ncbi:MAG TPA: DUF2894 domain-containing protein [Rhodocyclaceae bacterium]|nr:DUF2894 domain-containing protein [Rhodocyclaceae bacterium]
MAENPRRHVGADMADDAVSAQGAACGNGALATPAARAQIEALRARGAQRFDPVGLRFIEALAGHAASQGGAARRVLDRRLARALAEYGERLDLAERDARDALDGGTLRFPESADSLRQHFETADFGRLHRLLARLDTQGGGSPLGALLAHIARHATTEGSGGVAADNGDPFEPGGELKALRYFRSTWSRLSVDRQLARAFAQAPQSAGPLNSHFLVLQALRQMRDVSPEYLEQFMSYADALLWLEQADGGGRPPAQKAAVRAERGTKRKSTRRKTR